MELARAHAHATETGMPDMPACTSAAEQTMAAVDDSSERTDAPPTHAAAPRSMIWIMAVASGLSVANLYYNQPLLADMARQFGVSVAKVSCVPMMTQIGYATGMLLLVPLGDVMQRRRLVVTLLGIVTAALAGAALARSLAWLAVASLAIGIFTVVPQILIPFTARMTVPARRGRAIGIVMCGLLLGILLSRTAAGYVGEHLGWRAMYWMAAGAIVVLAVALFPLLPAHEVPQHLPYRKLLASVIALVREHRVLRQAMLNGSLIFAAFSAFWATLVFRLSDAPFAYGSHAARVAGLFGLVGAVGALAAPLVGRSADRRGPRAILTLAAGLMIGSYLIYWLGGSSLWGLAMGVIVLDLATQAAQVSNQTRVYSLPASSHSRANTAYMVTYFIGGALGSLAGAWGWEWRGWTGVCIVGALFSAAALLTHLATFGDRRDRAG